MPRLSPPPTFHPHWVGLCCPLLAISIYNSPACLTLKAHNPLSSFICTTTTKRLLNTCRVPSKIWEYKIEKKSLPAVVLIF